MGRVRRAALAGLAVLATASASSVAAAHGQIGSRFDAPLPLVLVYGGAGATVALTAAWLAVTDGAPSAWRTRTVRVPATVAGPLRAVARVGFLALFVAVVAAGLTGRQVAAENLATVVAWPLWLKGLALVAVVAGDPWRVCSPWRTIHAALSRLEGRELGAFDYPDRLASWPAVVAFVAGVGVVENLTGVPASPAATATLLAGYATVMVVGGLAFGPAFFDRADALAVLYRLFGRVSPLAVGRLDDGGYRVGLRAPWADRAPVEHTALVAFVVAAVYTVTFDGLAEAPAYQDLLFGLRDAAATAGLSVVVDSSTAAGVVVYLAGFVAFLAAYLAASALVAALGGGGGDRSDWLATARAFAPTVVPIAAAYEVAHSYPYVLRNLGVALGMVRGALGGSDAPLALLAGLSLPTFWWSQVLLVVAGHVVAVVAAHRVAVERFDGPAAARRGHLPLVVVMVGYTVLSLWVVSRPVAA